MDVPNIFQKLSHKEKPEENFLAIEIGSETIATSIWRVIEGKTEILSTGTTEDWEQSEDNEALLTAIDTSFSKALEKIELEPNKVIFGLQEGWVQGETILKDYSKLLKQICEKFEFEPIGFVVTTEAIIQLLKKQEGTPPTAIFIRVNEAELQVNLVNLGKVVGTEIVARSEDIGADVEEGLARFEMDDNLPSRILLFNSEADMEKLQQDLLSYDWLDKLPFLHFPKIRILEKNITIKAVALSGGAEAAKALGFEIVKDEEEEIEEVPKSVNEIIPAEKITKKEKEKDILEEKDSEDQNIVDSPAEDIGFKTGIVIGEQEEIQKPQTVEKKAKLIRVDEKEETKVEEPGTRPEKAQYHKRGILTKFKSDFSFFPIIFSFPLAYVKNISKKFGSKTKITILVTLFFFFLLIALGVYGYWIIPKAKLTLFVRPKTLEKEIEVTISPDITQVLEGENSIPGKLVETEIEGTKEIKTSGSLTVGEKATGEVTIFNKTSAPKTFPSGTIIIGPNNLKFTLDSEISIASASSKESDEGVTTTFGKTNSKVTANAIGAEYNLQAEENFRFESFSSSSYSAKNDKEFSGGTSREVQAIAQDDVNNLSKDLISELKQKAAEELEKSEEPGTIVLSEGAESKVISKQVSGDVGDQAQTVSATIKLKVITFAYEESDFNRVLLNEVKDSIPENFRLREEDSIQEILSSEFADSTVILTVFYKARLIPDIDEEAIKDNIIGKYPTIAQDYLESLPNYSKTEIEISPGNLPARLKTFPKNRKNISIEIKVEES